MRLMNMIDSSFLCLDLGSATVRAMGVHIRAGRIAQSAVKICESSDTVFALKTAVDEVESEMGKYFDSAYVTGNFGLADSKLFAKTARWAGEHKISNADLYKQIGGILSELQDAESVPLHIIPIRYDMSSFKNIKTPVNQVDTALSSIFHVISYARADMRHAQNALRSAHIECSGFYDPAFLVGTATRKNTAPAVFLDLGAAGTTASLWTARGVISVIKIPMGMTKITDAISKTLSLSFLDAERIKKENFAAVSRDRDRFTVADARHELSRADIIDAGLPILRDILDLVNDNIASFMEKNTPTDLYVYGGGANIPEIDSLLDEKLGMTVHNLGADAAVTAAANMVWGNNAGRAKRYENRHRKWAGLFSFIPKIFKRKKRRQFIPILPTTLSFNMTSPATYQMFDSAGISMIHCDVMDGFYVDRIFGSMEELKFIREHTRAHLNVHLMTDNPLIWAESAAVAGADTITISTGVNGVRPALKRIRELGKRAGIALHPDAPLEIIKPILRDIDEVLVMSVTPGAGGQKFMESAVYRISTLANTRKKYGLKFKISVDGGINADNAQKCWAAGADFLMVGTYLASAADFPLAVQSLLPKN
jgi:ribulose-phosphate 3-epimerase